MKTDTNFKFNVSLSTGAYRTKEEQTAAISSRRECRRLGLREKMSFQELAVTATELLNCCIHGYTFCNLFDGYLDSEGRITYRKKDGSFTLAAKADRFFAGSWTLCVDIDETAYTSISDFLGRLPLKPTLWYTSFSNGQPGKGLRFRLVYVLDRMVPGKYFFRYCVTKLNDMIEQATGEEIHDKCNLRASQYFNGTNVDTPGIISEYGQTGIIYSLPDIIGCGDLEDYEYFLACELQRKDISEQDENWILSDLDPDLYISDDSRDPALCVDRELFHDTSALDYDSFQKKWRREFDYIYRCEFDGQPWKDGYYKIVGPHYFQLYYNAKNVPVGGGRKKILLQRSCLRRLMKPWTTASELYWNLYEDCLHPRKSMVDLSDGSITPRTLKRIAQKAMSLSLREIIERYSENIEWLMEHTMPKDNIIISLSGARKAFYGPVSSSHARRMARHSEVVEGNQQVSRSTEYRIRRERGDVKRKVSDEELIPLLDPKLSARKNREHIADMGIAVSRERIGKLLSEMPPVGTRTLTSESIGVSFSVPTFPNLLF